MSLIYASLIILVPFALGDLDWLVSDVQTPTKLSKRPDGSLELSNGLITRVFSVTPGFTTIDYYSHTKKASLLRCLNPEASISFDYVKYNVGSVVDNIHHAYLNRTALKENVTEDIHAFKYVRHSVHPPDAPFSYTPKRFAPKDIVWPPKGLRLDVEFVAPRSAPATHRGINITIHYEMYDGIPLMSKWLTINAYDPNVELEVRWIEKLGVNRPWSPDFTNWLFIENDIPHAVDIFWEDEADLEPGAYQPVVTSLYVPAFSTPIGKEGFETYRVHELVTDTSDPERLGLSRHRMVRLLAPHTQESPIFFHTMKGKKSDVIFAIDQMADVGFELLVYSFGSGFNFESADPAYLKEMKEIISYANSKGIEVGGYDLIVWGRHNVPNKWQSINPVTAEVNREACLASGWYDHLLGRLLAFIRETGLSNVETDGPYAGHPCGSGNHSYHRDAADSIYQNTRLQSQMYKILRDKEIYINQPDRYFYQGGNRESMGYSEFEFSLPRWQDLSVSRQIMYDDLYQKLPTQGWMFVPLVPYHSGGKAAAFEPLTNNSLAYSWALAQYMGAGVSTSYRGYRLYDSNHTRDIVLKWTNLFKQYRDIITSDVIHVRRPDMQAIDCFLHVNPKLPTPGLAMVFNPTMDAVEQWLKLPLYYTGLTEVAKLTDEFNKTAVYKLDREYYIDVLVNLPPQGITWYIAQ